MKRTILVSVCLAGCSVTSTEQPPLTPLPTTGLQVTDTSAAPMSDEERYSSVFGYLQDVRSLSPETSAESDEELVRLGVMWCDMMNNGATQSDIVAYAEDRAKNDDEVFLWVVSASKASEYICPEHEYRWNP